MKAIYYLAFAIMALSVISCDDKKDGFRPEQAKISGPLGDYFEVIDRSYGIKDGRVMVEIKRIKKGLPAPWEEGISVGYQDGCCKPLFSIEVKDEKGDIIAKDESDIVWEEDELRAIVALSVDETSSIPFSVVEGGKSFKIGSSFIVNPKNDDIGDDIELLTDDDDILSDTEEEDETLSDTEEEKPSLEVILPSALKGKVKINYCGAVIKDSYGFPEVEIGFELLKTVNTSSLVSSYNQMWIVGVGLDKNGRNVTELLPNYGEWRTDDSDGNEFKEFLESEPGETINMTFTGGNEGDVNEGIDKVAKFKLKISN